MNTRPSNTTTARTAPVQPVTDILDAIARLALDAYEATSRVEALMLGVGAPATHLLVNHGLIEMAAAFLMGGTVTCVGLWTLRSGLMESISATCVLVKVVLANGLLYRGRRRAPGGLRLQVRFVFVNADR